MFLQAIIVITSDNDVYIDLLLDTQCSLYLVSGDLPVLPLGQLLVEVFSGGGWSPVGVTLLKERDILASLANLSLRERVVRGDSSLHLLFIMLECKFVHCISTHRTQLQDNYANKLCKYNTSSRVA